MDGELYFNCICRSMLLLTEILHAQKDSINAETIDTVVLGIRTLSNLEKEYRGRVIAETDGAESCK